jgi:hypothetical protein
MHADTTGPNPLHRNGSGEVSYYLALVREEEVAQSDGWALNGRKTMRIGGVELYLNHPVVLIGSTDPEPGALQVGEGGVAASTAHVMVATKANVELVSVRLWLDEEISKGRVIFNGTLDLDDGRLAVGDHAGLWRFVATLGKRGTVRLAVAVDEVGSASTLDVYIEPAS